MFFRKDSSINKLFSFALAAFLALGPAGCGGVTGPGLTLGSADITDSFSGGNSDGATSGGRFLGQVGRQVLWQRRKRDRPALFHRRDVRRKDGR